jgi:DNA-binding CsgD family transcriptional regulator
MTATASRHASAWTRLQSGADLEHLDPTDEPKIAAQFARLLALMAQDDFSGVREPAESILARGERTVHHDPLSGALTALAFVAWNQARVRDACGLLGASVRRADGGGAAALRVYPHLALGAMLTAVGEFGEADIMITRGRDDLASAGTITWADAPSALRARLLLVVGRPDEAVAEAERALRTSEQFGTRLFAPLAHSTVATAALLRGDFDEATHRVEQCEQNGELRTGFGCGQSHWIEARIVEARRGPSAALEASHAMYDDVAAHKRLLVEEPGAAAWLVRVALAAGDVTRARKVVACSQQVAADNDDIAAVEVAAIHARGLFDRDPGPLTRAAEGHRHPWARASASEDLAAVLGEQTPGPEASVALEGALAMYEEAGADCDAGRVRERLGGVKAPGRNGRPVEGWASLTPTERQVAENVAQGMTNRVVAERMRLSPHTIDVHLRHIFRKLNIKSRVALARVVLARSHARQH